MRTCTTQEEIELNILIASNIRKEMKRRCLKTKDMSEITGININSFYDKMRKSKRHSRFTIFELIKIADELMIPIDDLVKG